MISGPDHAYCLARMAGYRSALEAAGLPVDPELIVRMQLTREDGHAAAAELLARPDRPRSSPPTTSRQLASTKRHARPACASRRT
ncbi:hypothetical protein [Streptomyces canus]|uniref:hypothetical protein n=1 Tax=Streptomyces canus TaxID=58343 RepID=UPI00386F3DDF